MLENKKSTIASNIKKYRTEKGISQDKLSKLAGVAFHTVAKIETGNTPNPSINTIKKISSALDISVDDLIKEFYEKK